MSWNQRLLTTLLRMNNGMTQSMPKKRLRKGCTQLQMTGPIPVSSEKTRVRTNLSEGSTKYSKNAMLNQKTPPFNALHCKTRFRTFDSLKMDKNGLNLNSDHFD